MPVLRTSYEVSYPTRAFYSVERTGFTTVSELFEQLVNDLLFTGAFARPTEVGTVFYTETATGVQATGTWPVQERQFIIDSRGSGYDAGDYLIMRDFEVLPSRRFAIQVTEVDPVDGKIVKFSTFAGTKYPTVSNVQPTPMGYSTGASLSASPKTTDPVGTFSELKSNGQFLLRTNVSASSGEVPDNRGLIPGVDAATWLTNWGTNGSGGGEGTTWPTNNAIWFFDTAALGRTGNIKVGQEIFVDPAAKQASTNIPPGTTITSIQPMQIVTNSAVVGTFPTRYAESRTAGRYITLSNSVTIMSGETVLVRGTGASFYSNTTRIPDAWNIILESKGAGDILSDGEPILATTAVSSGNLLVVKDMFTRNPYYPEIYPGMRLTSNLAVGGTVSGAVYVKDVIKANVGWTRMTLTSNQSITVNEGVKFTWDTLQPYRIRIRVLDSQTAEIYTGTEIQIPVGGKISYVWNPAGTQIVDIAGILGNLPTRTGNLLVNDQEVKTTIATKEPDPTKVDEGFINRRVRIGGQVDKTNFPMGSPETYPMSYTMTVTRRGLFFGIWESNWSVMQRTKTANDAFFNWCLIQRPVDRITGRTLSQGRCPVFCINSVAYKYWKFILREADALHPTVGDPECKSFQYNNSTKTLDIVTTPYRVPADRHSQDSFAILNSTNQIALTEESKFLISFLNNLTTPRFRYSEELDIVGQTSADVVMATNDITITAYKESGPRTYRAMPANNQYNTGLRIAVLKDIPPYVDQPV
jgi:hypothetical protein